MYKLQNTTYMRKAIFITVLVAMCIGCTKGYAFNYSEHEEPEKIELTENDKSNSEWERGITNLSFASKK